MLYFFAISDERRPINRDRRRTGNYSYYLKMKQWDTEQFFKYTRMTIPVFEKLILKIAPKIQHQYRSDDIYPKALVCLP
nr:unnamed protein product [Callosobruchus analis]